MKSRYGFTALGNQRPLAVKIVGGSDVCLSGCGSITKYTKIMELAPFERLKITDSSNCSLWGDTPTNCGAMVLRSLALFGSFAEVARVAEV